MSKRRVILSYILGILIIIVIVLMAIKPLVLKSLTSDTMETKKIEEDEVNLSPEVINSITDNKGSITLGLNPLMEGEGITIDSNNVITILYGGTYDISGNLPYGKIIITSPNDVTLNLNNVTINASSAIAIEATKEITLNINMFGQNNLTSSGSSVLQTPGDVIIDGDGEMLITNSKASGIISNNLEVNNGTLFINTYLDICHNIQINGGVVGAFTNSKTLPNIAAGESHVIALNLENALSDMDELQLLNAETNEVIYSFKPVFVVQSGIISSPNITFSSYYITKNNSYGTERLQINNQEILEISESVNIFG